MNSSKRGPAYGFKLSSLDTLCDTKSADKKISLLHYIQDTVRVKFTDLNNFDTELRFIEKAAQGEYVFHTVGIRFSEVAWKIFLLEMGWLPSLSYIYLR